MYLLPPGKVINRQSNERSERADVTRLDASPGKFGGVLPTLSFSSAVAKSSPPHLHSLSFTFSLLILFGISL